MCKWWDDYDRPHQSHPRRVCRRSEGRSPCGCDLSVAVVSTWNSVSCRSRSLLDTRMTRHDTIWCFLSRPPGDRSSDDWSIDRVYHFPLFLVVGKKHQNLLRAFQNPGPTVGDFFQPNPTLKEEICWAIKVVTSHYSYKSCEKAGDIFQTMLPNSQCGYMRAIGSD